jgi:hypothetical protein
MRQAIRVLALVALFAAISSTAAEQSGLTVDGTEFVLTIGDGRILRSADLVGATLKVRSGTQIINLTIQGVEEDPEAKGGKVVLHHFLVQDENGTAAELCTPDATGRSRGFPAPDGRGGFDLTCISGVVAKCIRWGYRFWEEQPGGPPLRSLHHACVRMARADYGGDGQAATRDGTMIDLYDRFGIQTPERLPSMTFEAAWGVEGAVCVAHPRIPENISLEQIAERYPRLTSQLGPSACTEEAAMRNPAALLFNRSH